MEIDVTFTKCLIIIKWKNFCFIKLDAMWPLLSLFNTILTSICIMPSSYSRQCYLITVYFLLHIFFFIKTYIFLFYLKEKTAMNITTNCINKLPITEFSISKKRKYFFVLIFSCSTIIDAIMLCSIFHFRYVLLFFPFSIFCVFFFFFLFCIITPNE